MRPQNQIWCGTPLESNCKATTNVSRDQWCAYLSHFHFNFSSTRAPPASIHVGVALPKQMRPLTCTILLSSAVMHPRATAGVGGGTTPGCNGSSDSTQLYTDVIRISMILRCTLVQ